jgi:tetratricopeptide (TPR) repeat protein
VLADHGEAFGEHGERPHGVYCYDSTLRIPMILRRADGRRAGERDASQASAVDVHPTLCAALGLDTPGGLDGLSLWNGPAPSGRGAYFESYFAWLSYGWSPLAGWADAQGKYIASSAPEFYRLPADPHEGRECAAEARELVERQRRAIADLSRLPRLELADPGAAGSLHDPLQALGYAGAGAPREAFPEPLAESMRPAPAAQAGELALLMRAAALAGAGRYPEALPLLEQVLARNPGNYKALDHQGYALIQLGRHAEALPPLERLEREGPLWAATWYNLGVCLKETGKPELALEKLRRCAELDPENALALAQIVTLLESAGKQEEARPFRERLLRLGQR